MTSRISVAAYLALISIQFAVIIGYMVHSEQQESRLERVRNKLNLAKTDAADWEQIANSYKRAATTYALSSEKCLQTVRYYQSGLYQPQEIGK